MTEENYNFICMELNRKAAELAKMEYTVKELNDELTKMTKMYESEREKYLKLKNQTDLINELKEIVAKDNYEKMINKLDRVFVIRLK